MNLHFSGEAAHAAARPLPQRHFSTRANDPVTSVGRRGGASVTPRRTPPVDAPSSRAAAFGATRAAGGGATLSASFAAGGPAIAIDSSDQSIPGRTNQRINATRAKNANTSTLLPTRDSPCSKVVMASAVAVPESATPLNAGKA